MNILFFRPAPPQETIGLQHVMVVEPLELEILATLAARNDRVAIVDLILENRSSAYFIKKHDPDIVCVTGYITHTLQMLEICREAKRHNEKTATIVGGVYVEKVPGVFDDPGVDYRVVRNAAVSFPRLIDFIKGHGPFPGGVLKRGGTCRESELPDYDFSVPIPDRRLTERYRSRYFYVFHNKVALLKTSFGCPFPCSFCYCRKITGDNYHQRPLAEVIAELQTIKEREIYIIDDNFLVSEKRVKDFIALIRNHGIHKKYLIYGRADFIAQHPELIREFKRNGLRTVIVGFESFKDSELDRLKKHTSARTNEEAMAVLNQNGIDCYASVIAMPSWDKADFDRVAHKLIELRVRFLNVQPLTPLETTDMAVDETSLIVPRTEFARWDLAHVVIRPDQMTVKEYYREILRLYERVLFQPSNLIHHLRYPPIMQLKLLWGALKVKQQYLQKIIESE
jgi:radical SAM superfamily enzyme YgiQ (UPF0313 family)